MESIATLIEVLEQDPVRNCNLLNFIGSYPISQWFRNANSVLVTGQSDQNWVYLSSVSPEELTVLTSRIGPAEQYFAAVEDWMIPLITRGRECEWQLSCIKLYLPGRTVLRAPAVATTALTPDSARFIFEHSHYQAYTTPAYIGERIAAGFSQGIYDGKALIGWVMTHDDGAIGFLQVDDRYRRRGYGRALLTAISLQLRQAGKLPFLHIEPANSASLTLCRQLGFIPDRPVHWLKLSPR